MSARADTIGTQRKVKSLSCNGRGGIRTRDLGLMSPPLWPTELPCPGAASGKRPFPMCERPELAPAAESNSGGRIRTCDLRVMSPTSYQTAPPRDEGRRS